MKGLEFIFYRKLGNNYNRKAVILWVHNFIIHNFNENNARITKPY